jgi:indolepyruvate ferredoxin oxidoreductase
VPLEVDMVKRALRDVSLDDKYDATEGRIYLNGLQALTRLPMVQIRRDRARGLNTAGFISGYRGSPLGGYDQELLAASSRLQAHDVLFRPGINEDLAATAIWGTQQVHLSRGARKDGVFGIWYGKGPGVDRSGDVFKHGNAAGSAKYGGVLCLAGDDHGAKSSSIPHQSDHAFMSALMPMLYPSSIREFIEMGLLGIAMSRYSGCWVGMKLISDTVETTASIDIAGEDREFVIPTDFELPPDGLNLRWPDDRWSQDHRLQNYKGYAAIAFARANRVDRVVLDTSRPRFGIVASGKAYEDVRQVLRALEIDERAADELGIRLYKVGMPWPLEPEGIRAFSVGLEEVLVVEERRELIENQIKQQLFNWRADVRPRIVGKFDDHGRPVLPLDRELTVGLVAEAITDRLSHLDIDPAMQARMRETHDYLLKREAKGRGFKPASVRLPFYCAGCPHNTSTRVIEGSRALAGIGCHFMAQWMDRRTETFSHMGGEGVPWVGTAPFTDEGHVFVNLGDGTYFHSGLLAIRQAVASGVNITYKLLMNDAVAMTGGQRVDGELTVPQVTHQLQYENVKKIYLLSEDPARYRHADLAPGTIVEHRDAVDRVMRELRETPGCTALVYDQTCAAEKRRRRKRKLLDDPPRRVFINADVCEACGDCSVQSNCVAVEPLETEFGRKRAINQSSCNKDYSCVKGFCPSFAIIDGGRPRRRSATELGIKAGDVPDPQTGIDLHTPYNIAVTGIGGTGVLTIGAIIGMAAHLAGKASMILDVSGLAQKGGAVMSQVRLAENPDDVTTARIATGATDLLIAADAVTAVSGNGIRLFDAARTRAVVNEDIAAVANFVENRDHDFREAEVLAQLRAAVHEGGERHAFTTIAEQLAGDAIATNVMMLGYAYQRGLLPIPGAAIERAIELNGVAVEANEYAFLLGRVLAWQPQRIRRVIGESERGRRRLADMGLEELIEHRAEFLTAYQDRRLAARYRALVERVRAAEAAVGREQSLTRAVAIGYARLLAYKDEYEVARLYTDGRFERELAEHFEGDYRVSLSLAPPLLPGRDSNTGRPRKRSFGPWVLRAMKVLARCRRLRGTPLDPFGWHPDRREERALIREYEALIDDVLAHLGRHNHDVAVRLAALPEDIRGYGPIKREAVAAARKRAAALVTEMRARPSQSAA